MTNQDQGMLSHFNQVLYVCAYSRPRYHVFERLQDHWSSGTTKMTVFA